MNLIKFGVATAAVVGGLIAVTAVAASQYLSGKHPKWNTRYTPFEMGVDAEDINFEASDGTALAGWWLDNPESEMVLIITHGHHNSMGDTIGMGAALWRQGYTVFVYDARGHGESADGPRSVGLYEQMDLTAAIDLAEKRRPDAKIGVWGFSMGGVTALLVAAKDPRVVAVVSDSAFADLNDLAVDTFHRFYLPASAVVAASDAVNFWRHGYRFADISPATAIRGIQTPLLIVHGGKDWLVPVSHADQLAAAAGDSATVKIYPNANHSQAYFTDRENYIDMVSTFFVDSVREEVAENSAAA